jgi:hypothetical protein
MGLLKTRQDDSCYRAGMADQLELLRDSKRLVCIEGVVYELENTDFETFEEMVKKAKHEYTTTDSTIFNELFSNALHFASTRGILICNVTAYNY